MSQTKYNVIYQAPDESLKKKYNIICCCIHHTSSDLNLFLKEVGPLFEGIIIIDYSLLDNYSLLSDKGNLLIYISANSKNINHKIIFDTAATLNSSWFCFLNSDERFLQNFDNLESLLNYETAIWKFSIILVSDNGQEYFCQKKSTDGIINENRLYKGETIRSDENSSDNQGTKCPIMLKKALKSAEWGTYGISIFTKTLELSGLYYEKGYFHNYYTIDIRKLNDLINLEIKEISDYFVNRADFFPYIGILGGETGTALLLAQLYLKTDNSKYLSKLKEWLDKIIDLINKEPQIVSNSPFFSSGIAGFGWLLCYIKENNIIYISDDYFEQIDDILQRELINCPDMIRDLLHGRLGIARYFIKRGNKKQVEIALEHLRKDAIICDNGECKWLSQNLAFQENLDATYDCGLAHGMAGILYFLGKSYEMGVQKDLCLKMGNGIMDFYFNIEQDMNSVGSFFPYHVKIEDNANLANRQFSRLAWCYGDLGILYSIYLFCVRTGNIVGYQEAVNKLLKTTSRKDCKFNRIDDAMLCHGAAGIAQMYNHLYFMTNEKEFRDTALYWFKVSAKISRDESVVPPFKFVISSYSRDNNSLDERRDKCLGLLEGATGVGLAFLSAFDYNHINWDEVLMLY